MSKKEIFNVILKILFVILIVFLIITVIKYRDNTAESQQKLDVPIMQISKMTILSNNTEPIYLDNIDLAVLYNTVYVSINETLSAIFSEEYIANTSQTLEYGSIELIINFEDNTITIPSYYTYSDKKMDNTVVVEIEEYENKKFIPLYLVSNLGNLAVNLDGIEIYDRENYITSYDVIKKSNEKHSIEINIESQQEQTKAYWGQAKGSLWREEALKRIEKYRRKEIKIAVKNQNDKILDNAYVNIEMDTNEFKFGTAVAYAGTISNDYSRISDELFNILGSENVFKWPYIEKLGDKMTKNIEMYALENNMTIRGHCLWWDRFSANELKEIVGSIDNFANGTMAYVYKNYSEGKISIEEAELLSQDIQNRFEQIVLNHIEEEIKNFPSVSEWDVVNEMLAEKYFKIFLYDRTYLTDGSFLDKTRIGRSQKYTSNEEYNKFIAKCFDKSREANSNAKLVLNDSIVMGDKIDVLLEKDIEVINEIKKLTKSIDILGVQYHLANRYYYSPQSVYNNINRVLNETDINNAVITEYDNYTTEKRGNYTTEERKLKADYLRDILIMAYSNPNISEFCFWVYNSTRFDEEEREAYEELVTPWLNYSEHGISTKDGYTTRLYKGSYTAKVTLPNGKEGTVKFDISDDTSSSAAIVFNSKLTNIGIKQLPNSLLLYRGNELDLTGGVLAANYDDGTIEEIDMSDFTKVSVSGFNKDVLGRQTLTLTYENMQVTLDVNVQENMTNIVNNIKNSNNNIKQININILNNTEVNTKYRTLFALLDSLINDSENNNINKVDKILDAQFEVLDAVVKEYYNGNINLTTAELKNAIQYLINITENYKILYSYYLEEDNIDVNTTVKNSLNILIDKYNSNSGLGLSFLEAIILEEKNIYENELLTDNISNNYLNKRRIIKVSDILSDFIGNMAERTISDEKAKLKIIADNDLTTITDQNITVTLQHGSYTNIINNNGKDTYTFTENGSFVFKVQIAGKVFDVIATIDNIDKSKVSSNSQYKVDEEYIARIDKNTNANLLKETLVVDGSCKILRNGKEIQNTSENVATGDILKVGNKSYTLIVTGDINCDGNCNIKDLILYRNYLLDNVQLTEVQQKAADIKEDSSLNIKDLVNLRIEILK